MASLDSVLIRQALASGVVRQTTNDLSVGLRLRYVGTGTVTSVDATTGDNITLVTSDGLTDVYLFSAYTTVGAVADAINADGIFEAKVVDCLRSEGSDDFFLTATITSTTDVDGIRVWDLVIDDNGAATFSCNLSPDQLRWDRPSDHRVHLQEIYYNVTHTAAATTLRVYQRTKAGVETLLFAMLGVNATNTTVTFASGEAKITGETDADLIVQVTGTVTNATTNMIRVAGIRE